MTVRERLTHWWHLWRCRREGHNYDPWEAREPVATGGVFEEFRHCRRCGALDLQAAEHVVIALPEGRLTPFKLTGYRVGDGIRMPFLMDVPLRVTLGAPGAPPQFGSREYRRTHERDSEGRAIFQ